MYLFFNKYLQKKPVHYVEFILIMLKKMTIHQLEKSFYLLKENLIVFYRKD